MKFKLEASDDFKMKSTITFEDDGLEFIFSYVFGLLVSITYHPNTIINAMKKFIEEHDMDTDK